MKLARRAYTDLPVAYQNEIAKDRFVDGLDNKESRNKLREVSLKTLEDAASRAVQLEAIEAANSRDSTSNQVQCELWLWELVEEPGRLTPS